MILDVLKTLAAKVVGAGSTTMAAMVLIYMLGIAGTVNNFVLCVSLITFLAVFAIVIQCFKD